MDVHCCGRRFLLVGCDEFELYTTKKGLTWISNCGGTCRKLRRKAFRTVRWLVITVECLVCIANDTCIYFNRSMNRSVAI